MGNLRDNYTYEEWEAIENKIEQDRHNGKPEDSILRLSIAYKSVNELIELKKL